ncbi:putative ATPase/DNA-binding CsgD family transcriptional regulator [Streptomyces sp. V4I23]|uniref:ATP-binding protein n=1 Tax=Streptomyces sp. V4I23 TaxID=3042282 RepID=UPI0027844869|nr:LuxR C-terminal-related transcriptional regulator [Streptomyces sp. V4I23]MDQ1013332.1 putative ATPase/DNA-binding CsgD family transcriptional regulator [Streptomyces sp. V4I23]
MGANAVPAGATGVFADLSDFVGRRAEVAEVRRLFSQSRLVTLTGVGGVGKTRLALRVATAVARAFPDGVFVVELASVCDPGLVVQSVAAALGLQNQSSRTAIEVVADHVSRRRLLVVLDNCEHLVEACAQTVGALLRSSPGLRILATSRHVLGVTGEQVFPVPPLTTPAPDLDLSLEDLQQYQAVTLFGRRAAAVVPGFAVTADNAAAVGQLVHRLDGLPLAIELAAARLQTLTVQEILDRLEDRFSLLNRGCRTALPRQQTLRELMEWSYTLCTEQERLLWARMSVFAGECDLQAVEAVCAGDGLPRRDIVDLVHGLVEKSILIRSEQGGRARFRMLETVREYGHEWLADAAALRRRHRDHCLDLRARAQAEWFGPNQVAWLTRLRQEHANLRAALDYCLATPGQAEAGMALAVTPRHYWITGSLHEGCRWLARLLAVKDAENTRGGDGARNSAARVAALGSYGFLLVMQGSVKEAMPALEEYRESAERLGDASALAWAQHHLGLAAAFSGELPRAAALFEESAALHRDLGDLAGATECLFKQAVIVCLLGDPDRALDLCRECETVTAAHGESWIRADALFAQGLAWWQKGERYTSEALARQAIGLMLPLNDRWGIALCTELLAWSAAAAGRFERAAQLLGILHSLWETIGGAFLAAPFMAEPHQRCEKEVEAALPAKMLDQAFRRGAASTPEAAFAFILEEGHVAAHAAERSTSGRVPLTRRERQVAGLIAAGMTNKEIAATLVIAQRTAENHVERLLSKLGFSSRLQVAVWVHEHRGTPHRQA